MFRYIFLVALFLCVCTSSATASASGFVYPIAKIAVPSCRFDTWNTLDDDCKQDLPHISGADYMRYKDDTILRRIYTVLWGATYDYGWDIGNGAHQGVDIATSAGTPVQAIGDGTVTYAGWKAWWGNVVTIRHTLTDGTVIFSDYAHLSKILTSTGVITLGTNIGEVGNTGNSFGNHLHFQIDTSDTFHPYYYTSCAKGKNEWDIVNSSVCYATLASNTIDPIRFLESQNITANSIAPQPITNAETIKQVEEQSRSAIIEQKDIRSRQDILDEEMKEFLGRYTIRVSLATTQSNAFVGQAFSGTISVNRWDRPFSGTLPGNGIRIDYDPTALSITPANIYIVDGGIRDFSIIPLREGKYPITIRLGTTVLYESSVSVFTPGNPIPTKGGVISLKKDLRYGDETLGAVALKTPLDSVAVGIPYVGTYYLSVRSGSGTICNVSKSLSSSCSDLGTSTIRFSYGDTRSGLLLFRILPHGDTPIILDLSTASRTRRTIRARYTMRSVSTPIDFDRKSPYAPEWLSLIKRGIYRTDRGYLLTDREILGRQSTALLQNTLAYIADRTTDPKHKQSLLDAIVSIGIKSPFGSDYDKVTRGAFLRILFQSVDMPTATATMGTTFLDEAGDYVSEIHTARVSMDFSWRDTYTRYYQPQAVLTVGDALYLVERYIQYRSGE